MRAFEPFFMPFSPVSRWSNTRLEPAFYRCVSAPQVHTSSQLELRHSRNRPTTQTGRRGSVQLSVCSAPARTALSSFLAAVEFRQYLVLAVPLPLYEMAADLLTRALHIVKSPTSRERTSIVRFNELVRDIT